VLMVLTVLSREWLEGCRVLLAGLFSANLPDLGWPVTMRRRRGIKYLFYSWKGENMCFPSTKFEFSYIRRMFSSVSAVAIPQASNSIESVFGLSCQMPAIAAIDKLAACLTPKVPTD